MAALIGIVLLIILDQVSKLLALKYLRGQGPLVIIENFFSLSYVENRGAAFGILQGQRWLFFLVTLVVVAVLAYFLFIRKPPVQGLMRAAMVLIMAGSLGNFIDRVTRHFVVDFLSFRILGHNFAVFNLADSFIVLGTLLLFVLILKSDGEELD